MHAELANRRRRLDFLADSQHLRVLVQPDIALRRVETAELGAQVSG